MNKRIRIIIFCYLFFHLNYSNAQQFNIKQFEKNLYLSQFLLQKQPSPDSLNKIIPKEYKIDSIATFNYYITDRFGQKITFYLHIKTFKIVYVELYENQKNYTALKNYLINHKKFIWIASEHNCDYLNNKKLSIMLCPSMEKGVMIHISLYDL